MNREIGGRRSPEAWSSPHDRARARLAERMTEPLEPAESAWLDAHLVDCAACREVDAAYHSDREYLRAMRVIPPPRDLWARTSTALDAEQARAGGGRRRSRPVRRRTSATVVPFPGGRWAPIGALGSIAAVMVVGFLLGNMLIGTGPASTPGVAIAPTATSRNLVPTAIPVPKSDVAWVSTTNDGSIVVRQAPVNDVCPADAPAGCAPFDRNASQVATLSVKPTSVHQSPTSGQMIVFGRTQSGTGLTMFVLNTGSAPPPTAPPTVTPTAPPTTPPSASTSTSAPSGGSPSGSGDASSPSTSARSSPTAPATATPPPTASPTPKATATASIVPNVTPPPSAAALIAVATDLGVLNAETAAYSPDGAWFAFTARRLDNPTGTGSDIYLWHAGDVQARAVTTDGRSVFAGWVGNRLAGSSADVPSGSDASPSAAAPSTASPSTDAASDIGEFSTTSFLVNPATLDRTSIPTAAWRPAVDPTGKSVVYWEGTVTLDPANGGWRSATGRLVIRAWPVVSTASPSAPASTAPASPSIAPSPSASAGSPAATSSAPGTKPSPKPVTSPASSPAGTAPASPATSPSVTPSPKPTATPPSGLPENVASAAGVDWAVAWDETGTHLAVWIGDKADRTFGHLNLLTIGTNGLPTAGGGVLTGESALPGFSLADGHLAWATPVGTNGDGSTLKIYAYSGKDPGFGGPGVPGSGTVIVVQH